MISTANVVPSDPGGFDDYGGCRTGIGGGRGCDQETRDLGWLGMSLKHAAPLSKMRAEHTSRYP